MGGDGHGSLVEELRVMQEELARRRQAEEALRRSEALELFAAHAAGVLQQLRVLVLTALSFQEAREVARLGADDFVEKPCAPEQVGARARQLLARTASARAGASAA